MNKRRIYTLNGLPPEVIAVAFAKCSRSPESFDKISKELNADLSRKFHERWVVGYGHSSVAEHAVLSLAIENVSVIATKVIEDNRLASYTEKSTRYQAFDKDRVYRPTGLGQNEELYNETIDYLMDKYEELNVKMRPFIEEKYPKEADESDRFYKVRIDNVLLDNTRYILPAAILTNLGMTVNARQLEHAIVKMMTHPLKELRDIGQELKDAAIKVTPTLIKYTKKNDYIDNSAKSLAKYTEDLTADIIPSVDESVELVESDENPEDKIIAALIFRDSHISYGQAVEIVAKMDISKKSEALAIAMKDIGKFDAPIRELEHAYFTFDILVDYGAFRDIQRHRMCTQTNQLLTTLHGFDVPDEVNEAGYSNFYKECMEKADLAFKEMAKDMPHEASYIVPLAYKKRVLIKWNLREIYHFVKLRSGHGAHPSYKSVAQQIYRIIEKKYPLLAKHLVCDLD
ncbi:FAD-dependent thymidylate synthase [Candidatus Woesearchaeota archaeon]|nr:FAD-dependent thymidylate synthase [Candidatus Woesearchaeota archaeon]